MTLAERIERLTSELEILKSMKPHDGNSFPSDWDSKKPVAFNGRPTGLWQSVGVGWYWGGASYDVIGYHSNTTLEDDTIQATTAALRAQEAV
jgi:hypothetical protein